MSASPYPRPASRPCSCYRSAIVSRSRGDCSRPKPPSRSLPRAAWPPDVVHRAAAVMLALGTDTINSVAPYPGDIVVPPLATRPLAQSWTAEVPARLDWPPTGATTRGHVAAVRNLHGPELALRAGIAPLSLGCNSSAPTPYQTKSRGRAAQGWRSPQAPARLLSRCRQIPPRARLWLGS
jgi:hypothetical protein